MEKKHCNSSSAAAEGDIMAAGNGPNSSLTFRSLADRLIEGSPRRRGFGSADSYASLARRWVLPCWSRAFFKNLSAYVLILKRTCKRCGFRHAGLCGLRRSIAEEMKGRRVSMNEISGRLRFAGAKSVLSYLGKNGNKPAAASAKEEDRWFRKSLKCRQMQK